MRPTHACLATVLLAGCGAQHVTPQDVARRADPGRAADALQREAGSDVRVSEVEVSCQTRLLACDDVLFLVADGTRYEWHVTGEHPDGVLEGPQTAGGGGTRKGAYPLAGVDLHAARRVALAAVARAGRRHLGEGEVPLMRLRVLRQDEHWPVVWYAVDVDGAHNAIATARGRPLSVQRRRGPFDGGLPAILARVRRRADRPLVMGRLELSAHHAQVDVRDPRARDGFVGFEWFDGVLGPAATTLTTSRDAPTFRAGDVPAAAPRRIVAALRRRGVRRANVTMSYESSVFTDGRFGWSLGAGAGLGAHASADGRRIDGP